MTHQVETAAAGLVPVVVVPRVGPGADETNSGCGPGTAIPAPARADYTKENRLHGAQGPYDARPGRGEHHHVRAEVALMAGHRRKTTTRRKTTAKPKAKPKAAPSDLERAWGAWKRQPMRGTARAAWQHRRPLAPVYAASGAAVGAGLLHHGDPAVWPLLAAPTAAGAALLAAGPALPDSLLERAPWLRAPRLVRAWHAAVAAGLGGWAAWTTWQGLSADGLLALAAGTGLLGLPWWLGRPGRAPARETGLAARWAAAMGSEHVKLRAARLDEIQRDEHGYTARVLLPPGVTLERLLAERRELESAMGARRGWLRFEPYERTRRADHASLRLLTSDPLAETRPWPGPPEHGTVRDRLPLAIYETGETLEMVVTERHWLIAGESGGGKSGIVNVVLGWLAGCEDVVVWGIDPQAGKELAPWRSVLGRLAADIPQAEDLLAALVRVMETRLRLMAARGLRSWPVSRERPAIVLIVDELAEVADQSDQAIADLDRLARRARAAGIWLVLATQRPTQEALGSAPGLRPNTKNRVCARLAEGRDTDMILGSSSRASGYLPDQLDAPGKLVVRSPEHTRPTPARAYWATDAQIQRTAQQLADRRPRLDPESQAAADGGDGPRPSPSGPPGPGDSGGQPPVPPTPLPRRRRAADRLRQALTDAGPEGAARADLLDLTGLSTSRLHELLGELGAARTGRGRWHLPAPPSTTVQEDHHAAQ